MRDGDCGVEVGGAKAAFEQIINISKEEMERLRIEQEAADATAAKEAEITQMQVEEQESKAPQRTSLSSNPALIQPMGLIEADDDEDGSDDDYDDPSLLPSPPFRLMART